MKFKKSLIFLAIILAVICLFIFSNRVNAATISDDGEKCVLRETLLRKPRIGDANILKSYKGKCQRINSQCKFRNGELCNCSQNAIINIYENLTEKSIFKRSEDRKRYIYQW